MITTEEQLYNLNHVQYKVYDLTRMVTVENIDEEKWIIAISQKAMAGDTRELDAVSSLGDVAERVLSLVRIVNKMDTVLDKIGIDPGLDNGLLVAQYIIGLKDQRRKLQDDIQHKWETIYKLLKKHKHDRNSFVLKLVVAYHDIELRPTSYITVMIDSLMGELPPVFRPKLVKLRQDTIDYGYAIDELKDESKIYQKCLDIAGVTDTVSFLYERCVGKSEEEELTK